ncbi:murein biosynthesis integral membrane protein MurJ [Candidiatus Paracoxiella cheracis]|uniref:murein biosynthesis integral membrane protein MurJ n=1 Tax=Candidiatus Paracoxiella cheracis TaxID=3405120 RepID=UPI003BF4C6A5
MSQKLLRSITIVSGMTMISRIMGFVRDVVLASIFGAGPAFDAFAVAFKIPNCMRRLFGEGAFSQAFVPVLANYRTNRSHDEVQQFINHIAGTLGFALLIVVLLAEIIAPMIIMVFAPGFIHDPVRFTYATHMIRITFPYLLLIALTAFSGATLNTFNRFGIPAFTPVLLNVAMIAVALWWAPHAHVPIYVLAWGVLIGGAAQLLMQLPFFARINVFPVPKLQWRDPGVIRVLKLMVPALFGVSVAQISLLIDNFFASFLPAGSISWLYYSDRLTYLPLGVIGVALATVVLPNLSRFHSSNSIEKYSDTLDWALRLVVLVGVPAAVGLFILSGPLITTLFLHGKFNSFDVVMTRRALWAFSVGLPGFMLVKILASAFYSRQNIKTPVKIAAVAMVVNLILNLTLIKPLAHAGLALATSLASLFNASLLIFFLLRRTIFKPRAGWLRLLSSILFANIGMGVVIGFFAGHLHRWMDWSIGQRCWHLVVAVVLGVAAYIILLFICGLRFKDLRPPAIDD